MSLIQYQPGGGYYVVGTSKSGSPGPPGPPGPQGAGIVISAFSTINGGSVNLTNTYALIHSTTITTTGTGYILGQCSLQVKNTDNEDHIVDFYLVVNGSTSNVTTEDIRKITSGVPGYANFFIIHRSGSIAPGTYSLQLWGRYSTTMHVPAPGELVVDHVDLAGLGNLS